jgi:hypothetical protein
MRSCIATALNETDQEWIRMPLPLGSRGEGQGLRSLLGHTRSSLETLRDRMKETTPLCDKGTQGCAGAVSTLTGNMAMLQGLTKFVYETSFGGPLTERAGRLSSQGAQQRLWKEQAKSLLCAAKSAPPKDGGGEESQQEEAQTQAIGVHNTQGLGLSAELQVVATELGQGGRCEGGLREHGSAGEAEEAESSAAAEAERTLAEFLARVVSDAGGMQGQAAGVFLVAELPSATDDDMERASVAAMLLDRECVTLTHEQSAYINEACGDTGSASASDEEVADSKEL